MEKESRCFNKTRTTVEVKGAHTDLALLLWVFLHPHPGQVDLSQTDGQLEPFWTQDLSRQHAHHCFTVGPLKDQSNNVVSVEPPSATGSSMKGSSYLDLHALVSCGERAPPDSRVLTGPGGLQRFEDSPVFRVPSSPGGLRLVWGLADGPGTGGHCLPIPLRSRRTVPVVNAPVPVFLLSWRAAPVPVPRLLEDRSCPLAV
ncbi:uncharacterized protein [Takifugu rubripes]|uniref:uncharacterized protein n=1 Tax=Takifugu rubripes TaxID=31033 RepID=UPI001145989E|nr:uncharacterized protein LOC115249474 [Takifugu rubripes]